MLDYVWCDMVTNGYPQGAPVQVKMEIYDLILQMSRIIQLNETYQRSSVAPHVRPAPKAVSSKYSPLST